VNSIENILAFLFVESRDILSKGFKKPPWYYCPGVRASFSPDLSNVFIYSREDLHLMSLLSNKSIRFYYERPYTPNLVFLPPPPPSSS